MYRTDILRRVRKQRLLHNVTLELTHRCNLDCFFCYNDREKTGTPLSLEQYETLLGDLARMQTLFLMLSGGEPMLHPQFFEIARMTRELGFVVRVRTNGHTLTKENCRRLKDEVDPYLVEVSLHGAAAEVHDRQTRVPGSFERLIQNMKTAKEVGLRCGFITTPTAWNEHQIKEMLSLGDSLGIPLKFQGPVGPRDNGDTEPMTIQPVKETWVLIADLQKIRRESEPGDNKISDSDKIADEEGEPAMCSVGVAGVDIDPFGNVQACMHLQESAGNLHEQPIEEIWNNSPLFQRARARAVEVARQFTDKPPRQFGAPLFCLAVEENAFKREQSLSCRTGCLTYL